MAQVDETGYGGTMNIVTEYGEAKEYENWDDAWDAWIYSSDENATLEYVPTAIKDLKEKFGHSEE